MKKGIVIAIGAGKPQEKEEGCCEMCGQKLPESAESEMEDEDEMEDPNLAKLAEMMAMKQMKK